MENFIETVSHSADKLLFRNLRGYNHRAKHTWTQLWCMGRAIHIPYSLYARATVAHMSYCYLAGLDAPSPIAMHGVGRLTPQLWIFSTSSSPVVFHLPLADLAGRGARKLCLRFPKGV